MKDEIYATVEKWCIRKKGNKPLEESWKCGLDPEIRRFRDSSEPGESMECATNRDNIYVVEWFKIEPLRLEDEGYPDPTTSVVKSGFAYVESITNVDGKTFKVCGRDKEFLPATYEFSDKCLTKVED